MRSKFQYFRPQCLVEALEFLESYGYETSVLAGGTDLMIAVRKGETTSRFVMDVSRLDELRAIRKNDDVLTVGAAATFNEISNSQEVLECAPVLARAARHVGSLQIRNVGTVGGNVANASPAADGVPPLIVLQARVHIQSSSSERTPLVEELITAPYRTNLRPDELIVRFIIDPAQTKKYRWSFQRIARRKTLAIARANAAALAMIDPNGAVDDLRLCVGSILPQPARMTGAEEILKGRVPDRELIWEAAKKVSSEMVRLSGVRPTTEYKRPAVEGLVMKALTEILLEEKQHA